MPKGPENVVLLSEILRLVGPPFLGASVWPNIIDKYSSGRGVARGLLGGYGPQSTILKNLKRINMENVPKTTQFF